MHIYSFNDLKFTLKHLKRSYVFRSYDHPQGHTLFLAKVIVSKHSVIYIVTLIWCCGSMLPQHQINVEKSGIGREVTLQNDTEQQMCDLHAV